MNRLNGLSVYLSGPIDFAENSGAGWRNEITPYLEEKGLRVLDPLKHQYFGADELDDVKRPRMKALLEAGEYQKLREEMKEVIHWDLRSVDKSDFLIVNYDNSVHMCGTYEEIFIANTQNKPVLLVLSCPRNKLSTWMYGRFPPSHMFDSWDDLHAYLDEVDSGPDYFTWRLDVDKKRWLFDDGEHMKIPQSHVIEV
jgi:nucleoside 2-deoxyribosyltransferase